MIKLKRVKKRAQRACLGFKRLASLKDCKFLWSVITWILDYLDIGPLPANATIPPERA